jgi:hypothetical protein
MSKVGQMVGLSEQFPLLQAEYRNSSVGYQGQGKGAVRSFVFDAWYSVGKSGA